MFLLSDLSVKSISVFCVSLCVGTVLGVGAPRAVAAILDHKVVPPCPSTQL